MPVPAGSDDLYVVTLEEVKLHGNITTTASDAELLDFIGTSQDMVEALVGITVPRTFTQYDSSLPVRRWYDSPRPRLWLNNSPVMSVTSVLEYGLLVDPARYWVDVADGAVERLDGCSWFGDPRYPLTTVYVAGRDTVQTAIRWGVKELAIHLWRSTQAQRGGRARGDVGDTSAAGYGLPNRVREALEPFTLPTVGIG